MNYDQLDILNIYASYYCSCVVVALVNSERIISIGFNPLNTKRRLLCLKTQFVAQ